VNRERTEGTGFIRRPPVSATCCGRAKPMGDSARRLGLRPSMVCLMLCLAAVADATEDQVASTFSLEARNLQEYSFEKMFRTPVPYLMYESSDGIMWFAVEDDVVRCDGWTWLPLDGGRMQLGIGHVRKIVETRGPTLWFLTNAGLVCQRDGKVYRLRQNDGLPVADVRAVVEDRNGQLWAASGKGIAAISFDGGDGTPSVRRIEQIPFLEPEVNRALAAPDGSVWFMALRRSTDSAVIFRHKSGVWWPFAYQSGTPEDLPEGCLHDMAVDPEGNLLVTSCRSLYRCRNMRWECIGAFPGQEPARNQSRREPDHRDQNKILVSDDGSIWVYGLAQSGPAMTASLFRFSREGKETEYPEVGSWGSAASLMRGPNASVLAVTEQGVWQSAASGWRRWEIGKDTDHTALRQVLMASNGALWLLTQRGLFRYAMDTEPPQLTPKGDWPTHLHEATASFAVEAKDRWGTSDRVVLEVSLDGQGVVSQAADAPILLKRLSPGNHFLQVGAVDAGGNRQVLPAHPFRVSLPLWQRGDLLAILLISLLFVGAPSIAYASYKHRRLKQSLAALQSANVRLQQADRLKSDFVANVSHEFRTPLTAIMGFVDNLLDGIGGSVTEKQVRSLERVKANAERLGHLINDLLDLRRIESGRLELHCSQIKLHEVATGIIATLAPRAEERSIQISLGAGADCPMVWADRNRIAQVYTNIIGNALRFTPQGGRILVEVKTDGNGWVYSAVSDTGQGIPPEEQKRIFDRFYQVAGVMTGKTKGAGLGLAICKELVELHDGTMGVESKPGEGSTFFFRLPTVESSRT